MLLDTHLLVGATVTPHSPSPTIEMFRSPFSPILGRKMENPVSYNVFKEEEHIADQVTDVEAKLVQLRSHLTAEPSISRHDSFSELDEEYTSNKPYVPWRKKCALVQVVPSLRMSRSLQNPNITVFFNLFSTTQVGLPARGKSYIAHKVVGFLRWRGLQCDVFNVGKYRRVGTNIP